MVEAGSSIAEDRPVDVTEEVPLGEGDTLAPEPVSRWRRYRWPVVGAVVVLVGGALGLSLWLTSGSSTPTGLSVTTVTVRVTTGTIRQTVSSSGTLEPASQANLNFAVSGAVTAVNVKAGQSVTAGQVLATVDTTALSEQVNAAQAQLTAANDKLSSDAAAGASQSQIDTDQASVSSAESALSTAQTNLADASLTSTISGTVASVNLSVGQLVTGTGSGSGNNANNGSSSGSGSQIVVIGTDSYIVNTTVDDTQIGEITDGDQAVITPTGATTPVYGTVGSISLIGSQSSNVTTFPVVIDVTGNPTGLYAGASATVSIIVKQLNDVTEVPTGAISYNSSGQATVTEVVHGAHVVKSVTVGASENGETQITNGVRPGAKVLERQVSFRPSGGGPAGILGNGTKQLGPGNGLPVHRFDGGVPGGGISSNNGG